MKAGDLKVGDEFMVSNVTPVYKVLEITPMMQESIAIIASVDGRARVHHVLHRNCEVVPVWKEGETL